MDFSSVKPNTSSGPAVEPTGKFNAPGSRRTLWWIAAAVALAVVIIVIAVSCGGGSSSNESGEDAIKTAHGPNALVDGVPRGYTHDKSGARTAGVNIVQAVDQVRLGRLDGEALRSHAVADNPSSSLSTVLDDNTGRGEREDSAMNSVPLVATVTDFTPNEATVSVWVQAVSQSRTGGDDSPIGVSTSYSTTDVTLSWEDGDWKATGWDFETGPKPEDAKFPEDGPLSEMGGQGFYAFYRD